MSTAHRAKLASIRRFDQLIAYLRDEMDWPIGSESFEDLTFEYTPEELGIDSKNAAKIQEIKRLRPLSPNQPWGIFFVKFEPKRLPVVALRRILGQVALKKRASANSAERQAWAADDLLFVSNYGEGDERRISFAHFSKPSGSQDLPTLKVLGWDNLDTPLHLDDVAEKLTRDLAWPSDVVDVDSWRENWRAAFTLRHREVITTSKELSLRLAELARAICDRIETAISIENENGPLTKLMKAFQEALIHELNAEGFADMYAQTIAYGLLSARIADPEGKTTDDLASHMRTNPFLRELMETFLRVGSRRGKNDRSGIDFDELGVSEVVELLDGANIEAVIRDFGDQNPQEDPVIHFYEHFLAAYDKEQKITRGVFYTPRPVVSYIIRSVDELLRTEFGLEDGLADTTTWAEMVKRYKDLRVPGGVSSDRAFVQILDPATGTGTFLVEVINLIHKTMVEKWKTQGHGGKKILALWNEYVPKYLLPRLHGYELLMAPYAIAHLKISLKLYETGYRFGSDERARVYLTNALEPAGDKQLALDFLPAIAHEAQAVNEIKRKQRFTVVIGNPPYSKHSANKGTWIDHLMESYKEDVRGEQNIQPLSDDYIKFVRFTHDLIEKADHGLFSLVTNHSYISGLIHRGMRRQLALNFPDIRILELHGDSNRGEVCPDGSKDENVFDIQQGVAITIATRSPLSDHPSVRQQDIWGLQSAKYKWLTSHEVHNTPWSFLSPAPPYHSFQKRDEESELEYQAFHSAADIFESYAAGFVTSLDETAIHFSHKATMDALRDFSRCEPKTVREHAALKDLNLSGIHSSRVVRILYRPFDYRYTYYTGNTGGFHDRPRHNLMQHLLRPNLALVTTRLLARAGSFEAVLSASCPVEKKAVESSRSCYILPLYVYPPERVDDLFGKRRGERKSIERKPNLSLKSISEIAGALDLKFVPEQPKSMNKRSSTQEVFGPEDVLYYICAILHSPTYRERYYEFLKIDFPRVPFMANRKLFWHLVAIGGQIVSLQLMESPKLVDFITTYTGPNNPEIGRVGWSDGTVWLDAQKTNAREGQRAAKIGTIGIQGVPEEVWDFHIGGYQVCHKWLKDRKGRTLSKEDIAHYQKIVVALNETIRIMKEIDEVIEKHGGWPDAFATSNDQTDEMSMAAEKRTDYKEKI